ncbi:hypothetical protein GCM10028806_40230 [Spirosoma terrae]|uniref:Uncharacterized protein n=1 Tax=Spirosoma terrae TaxID=1968276 RepID=A0A6L9LE62_9BACT|nr:hypothetical protein [Spirosoma terrae]NDU98680.1 hypothetical protein [Spirosoma terrae]
MKLISCILYVLLLSLSGFCQKVANYSTGRPGTKDYEEFSFWVRGNKRSDVTYTFGEKWQQITVSYVGKDVLNGEQCFKVRFPNQYELYIVPRRQELKIADKAGKYIKYYAWKYEGPVNGVGTFCQPCADNGQEAMQLLKAYYLK